MKRNLFSDIFSKKILKVFWIVILFFTFNINISKASVYIHSGEKCEGAGNSKLNIDYIIKGTQVYINTVPVNDSITIDKLNKANTGCYFYSDSDILLTSSEIKTLITTSLTKYSEEFTKEYSQSVKINYTDKITQIKVNATTTPLIAELTKIIDNTKTYTGMVGATTTSFQSLYNDVLNVEEIYGFDDFKIILVRQRRIYLYKQLKVIQDKYQNLDTETSKIINEMINKSYDGGPWNWSGEEEKLREDEINPTGGVYGKVSRKGRDFPLIINEQNEPIKDPETGGAAQTSTVKQCSPTAGFWDTFIGATNCSIVAYLINMLLQGLNSLFKMILTLSEKLFDWVMGFSVYNFSDLVSNSGAYEVWRKVILALVTSLLLPIVFYYIIRMLIDNDTAQIQKILPKILFTALFVYFSFSIVGFLIDQANVFSIYIYRSLHNPNQSIASSMERLIIGDPSLKSQEIISLGAWDSVPAFGIQVLITGVAIIIFFQAAILIFIRGITLVLCMIFSPVMLLPAGINSYIDKYRDMVIKYFTNATIMAPIFLFLLLIAMKVGDAGSALIQNTSALTTENISGQLTGAAISGVISIIILQLAITTAKNLSGEIGAKVSGKISGTIGSLAFGGASKALRMGAGKVVNSKKFDGWIAKGGTRGRLALKLQDYAQNSTFDARNSKVFQAATKGTFGKGGNTTIDSSFRKRYAKEKHFYDRLNDDAKGKHINNLRSGWTGTSVIFNGNRVADRLESKNKNLSFEEKIDTNNRLAGNFNKINKESDKDKRKEKMIKFINNHFKENGKGEEYFSKELEKPKNSKLKEDFDKIIKDEPDENKRKEKIMKSISEFEEKNKKNQNTNNTTNTQNQQNQNTNNITQNQNTAQNTNNTTQNQNSVPAPSIKNVSAQESLKSRLQFSQAQSKNKEEFEKHNASLGNKIKNNGGVMNQEILDKELADRISNRRKALEEKRGDIETNLKKENKLRKEENQRYTSDQYQKTVLQDLEEKNRSKNQTNNTQKIRENLESISKDIKDLTVTTKDYANTLKNISLINRARTESNSKIDVIKPEENTKPNIVAEIGGNSMQNQSQRALSEMAHNLRMESMPVGRIEPVRTNIKPEKVEKKVNVKSTRKDNLDGNDYINR